MSITFDETKVRRAGNGTFAVKALTEVRGGTDALSDYDRAEAVLAAPMHPSDIDDAVALGHLRAEAIEDSAARTIASTWGGEADTQVSKLSTGQPFSYSGLIEEVEALEETAENDEDADQLGSLRFWAQRGRERAEFGFSCPF